MIPLAAASLGKEVVVDHCQIGGDLKRHVDSLGIIPGECITPIASNAGNLIVKIRESRFAINLGIANRIYVH